MKKRILSVLLCIATVVALMCGGAVSVSAVSNEAIVITGNTLTTDDGNGWEWDAEFKTLTLYGVDISVSSGYAIALPADSTIELVGYNKLTSTEADNAQAAAISYSGTLTVQGSGVLEVFTTHEQGRIFTPPSGENSLVITGGYIKTDRYLINAPVGDSTSNVTVSGGYIETRLIGAVNYTQTGGYVKMHNQNGIGSQLAANTSINISGGYLDINANGFNVSSAMSVGDNGSVNVSGGVVKAVASSVYDNNDFCINGNTNITGGVIIARTTRGTRAINGDITLGDPDMKIWDNSRNLAGVITVDDAKSKQSLVIAKEAYNEVRGIGADTPDAVLDSVYISVTSDSTALTINAPTQIVGGCYVENNDSSAHTIQINSPLSGDGTLVGYSANNTFGIYSKSDESANKIEKLFDESAKLTLIGVSVNSSGISAEQNLTIPKNVSVIGISGATGQQASGTAADFTNSEVYGSLIGVMTNSPSNFVTSYGARCSSVQGGIVTGYWSGLGSSPNGNGLSIENSGSIINSGSKVSGVAIVNSGTLNIFGIRFSNSSAAKIKNSLVGAYSAYSLFYAPIRDFGNIIPSNLENITTKFATELSSNFDTTYSPAAHVVYLSPSAPVFDDRFGGEVTVENYNTLESERGYTFDGWFTGIDGTGERLEANDTPRKGVVYYAKWKNEFDNLVRTTPIAIDDKSDSVLGDGITWDKESKTLTLENATVDVCLDEPSDENRAIDFHINGEAHIINLIGDNVVRISGIFDDDNLPDSCYFSAVRGGNLQFVGDGSLNAIAEEAKATNLALSFAIGADTLVFSDTVKITADSKTQALVTPLEAEVKYEPAANLQPILRAGDDAASAQVVSEYTGEKYLRISFERADDDALFISSLRDLSGVAYFPVRISCGDGGSVAADVARTYVGSAVSFTIEVEDGYEIAAVTFNGRRVDVDDLVDNGDGTYSLYIARVSGAAIIDVTFKAIT